LSADGSVAEVDEVDEVVEVAEVDEVDEVVEVMDTDNTKCHPERNEGSKIEMLLPMNRHQHDKNITLNLRNQ